MEKTNKKPAFDYEKAFGMNQKEFKKLSFALFLSTVDMMSGVTDLVPYVRNTASSFRRFGIEISEERVARVLIPSIARVMVKAGEIKLSFVTFKRLLKGEFETRELFSVSHKAKEPKAPAPRAPRKKTAKA